MRFQRLIALLMLLCLFPILSFADGSVINLIASPEKEYTFAEGVSILEVVFPPRSLFGLRNSPFRRRSDDDRRINARSRYAGPNQVRA